MSTNPFIRRHAIDRYLERVDPTAGHRHAATVIRQIATTGRARPTPRRWTGIRVQPATRYIYSAEHPGVCVVERHGVIRTVFARETSREWRAQQRRERHQPAA